MAETALPTNSQARKDIPLARGVLDYFPAALAEVAKLSKAGNDKHNPGEDLHWARGKSMDHADCILRHLAERGTVDPDDGFLHEVKLAWRALALLQESLEAKGAPLARGARIEIKKTPTPAKVQKKWQRDWTRPATGPRVTGDGIHKNVRDYPICGGGYIALCDDCNQSWPEGAGIKEYPPVCKR